MIRLTRLLLAALFVVAAGCHRRNLCRDDDTSFRPPEYCEPIGDRR